MSDTVIQWHPGFVAAMDLELKEYRKDLLFEKKYNLNTKPLEIDLLIIKKTDLTQRRACGRREYVFWPAWSVISNCQNLVKAKFSAFRTFDSLIWSAGTPGDLHTLCEIIQSFSNLYFTTLRVFHLL